MTALSDAKAHLAAVVQDGRSTRRQIRKAHRAVERLMTPRWQWWLGFAMSCCVVGTVLGICGYALHQQLSACGHARQASTASSIITLVSSSGDAQLKDTAACQKLSAVANEDSVCATFYFFLPMTIATVTAAWAYPIATDLLKVLW